MLIHWLIHDHMLTRSAPGVPDLARAAADAGHVVELRTMDELRCMDFPFSEGACAVAYGSNQFVALAKRRFPGRWQPGTYHRIENLSYSAFGPHLGDLLLNSGFVLLPFGEVARRRGSLPAGVTGPGGEFFLRPDAVTKSFTGLVLTPENFELEIGTLRRIHNVADDVLCVVAPPRPIDSEFRFVIADGAVVAGSEYRWDGRLDIRSDVLPECAAMAETVASRPWQADRVYVCDVGMAAGEPRVIELNAFSCSGLYACDTAAIVSAVGLAAWREHQGEDPEPVSPASAPAAV